MVQSLLSDSTDDPAVEYRPSRKGVQRIVLCNLAGKCAGKFVDSIINGLYDDHFDVIAQGSTLAEVVT